MVSPSLTPVHLAEKESGARKRKASQRLIWDAFIFLNYSFARFICRERKSRSLRSG
jgi:hypothetical protein